MTETQTFTRKVTFDDGLPLGLRATFTHEGERWIAYPAEKYWMIAHVLDRLIGLALERHETKKATRYSK